MRFTFSPRRTWPNLRESAKTDWGMRIVASMRRGVEERMTHDMEVPTLEAGHGHFYVCPIHNVTFSFRWDHPTAHYCAACDKEYRGVNRYNWGWVNFVHARNLSFLTNCMYLYLATGESRYAEYIRDMLLDYSNMYPDYMYTTPGASLPRRTAARCSDRASTNRCGSVRRPGPMSPSAGR